MKYDVKHSLVSIFCTGGVIHVTTPHSRCPVIIDCPTWMVNFSNIMNFPRLNSTLLKQTRLKNSQVPRHINTMTKGKATATVSGRTIAETDEYETVEGNIYVSTQTQDVSFQVLTQIVPAFVGCRRTCLEP